MASVKEYKCLNCKAGLTFDPASQKWKCGYCFSEFTKAQLDVALKEEEQEQLDQAMPDLDSYHCTSCGAELIIDGTISATHCLYCKSPAIIKSRFTGKFKPKRVIPFKLTKSQAEDLYRKWIKKRLFAPNEFKTQEEIKRVTGVYAPFWLFDCMVDGEIDGEGTKVSSWTVGEYRYTKTKYFRVVRKGKIKYHNIPVDASKKLDDTLMHKMEPYNYNDLTDFSLQYMSGFMAEKYDVEADEAGKVMKERVNDYTEERLKDTVHGYTSYLVQGRQISVADEAHDYSLLPVYILVNNYKEKEHIFMVNGQTGKVVGDAPISFLKQLVFAGSIFAIVWLVAVFGGALIV
ncbi:MAG TPA: DNA helicase PriA [Paenibacillaceae bacterium]|nr:DNA helicase PriA [Paenibacillaceae bacterium]